MRCIFYPTRFALISKLILKLAQKAISWACPRSLILRAGPPPLVRPMCNHEGIWVYTPTASPRGLCILRDNPAFSDQCNFRPVLLISDQVCRRPTRAVVRPALLASDQPCCHPTSTGRHQVIGSSDQPSWCSFTASCQISDLTEKCIVLQEKRKNRSSSGEVCPL